MEFAIGTIIAAVIAGIVSIAATSATNSTNQQNVESTNEANLQSVQDTNQANLDIANMNNQTQLAMFHEQMDYTKAVQQEEWARADSQLQRATADATAAGLSPLAALGSGAGSTGSVVSQPNAPRLDLSQMLAGVQNPFIADNIMDTSFLQSIIDAIGNDKKLSSQEKIETMKNETERYKITTEATTAANKLAEQVREYDKDFAHNLTVFTKEFNLASSAEDFKQALEQRKQLYSEIRERFGVVPQIRYTDNKAEYTSLYDNFMSGYSELVNSLGADYTSQSSSSSSSQSKDRGSNVGIGASVLGSGGNGSIGVTHNDSNSESVGQSEASSYAFKVKKQFESGMAKLIFPVYNGD